jgi:hypothetical protein
MRSSVSAATPLLAAGPGQSSGAVNEVFISASYGTGAALLKVGPSGAERVWAKDGVLSNHYATSILHHGFLYGIDGRTDPGFDPRPSLRCVELQTGKLRWEQATIGAATLTLAGDTLLILTERGELLRVPATADGFRTEARAQVIPSQVRAYPALADGLFYARSKDKLVCLDLRKAR